MTLLVATALFGAACGPSTAAARVGGAATAPAQLVRSPSAANEPSGGTPSRLRGWTVRRRITVPNWGNVVYGAGSLWVVDGDHGLMDGNEPAGNLYEIDPVTGRTRDRIPHAIGGFPAVGDDSVWLCTLRDNLDVVTRYDAAKATVARIKTSSSEDPEPEGIAVAHGGIWVANNFDGTVVEIDPSRNEVVKTVDVGTGVRGWPATDGHSVWFARTDAGEIVRIDAATGGVISRLELPVSGIEGLLDVGPTLYAATPDRIFEIDVSRVGHEEVRRDLLLAPQTGAPPLTLRWGFRSLWAVRADPGELLRIDPRTLQVVGRKQIHGVDVDSLVAIDLAVGAGAVWVRKADRLIELVRR